MAASDYTEVSTGSMVPTGTLSAAVTAQAGTLSLSAVSGNNLADIKVNAVALVGDEVMLVTSVSSDYLTIGVSRGCADTIPKAHASGATVWFVDETSVGWSDVTHQAGDVLGVKLLPYSGSATVPFTSAPVHTVTMNTRHNRPYPPGNVLINGAHFSGGLTMVAAAQSAAITWAHRDRLLQRDQLFGHSYGDIGPEPGVSYRLVFRSAAGAVIRTQDVSGNSYTYPRAQAAADYPGGASGTIELLSVRGSLESLMRYSWPVTVNVGTSQVITTEAGTNITTEAGTDLFTDTL